MGLHLGHLQHAAGEGTPLSRAWESGGVEWVVGGAGRATGDNGNRCKEQVRSGGEAARGCGKGSEDMAQKRQKDKGKRVKSKENTGTK